MSDVAYKYFNQLDSLDLPDLEILSDRIKSLIVSAKKKKDRDKEIAAGLAFFDSIKGSIDREIDVKAELASALDEKYAYTD